MIRLDARSPTRPFQLSQGVLCLDFANTWGNHADPGSDRLRDYGHVVDFVHQAGLLPPGTADVMTAAAAAAPEAAAGALQFAREVRQAIYRILSAKAGCREVPPLDVDRINAIVAEALRHRRLEQRDGLFCWGWVSADADDLRGPLWPIIESAAALFTSKDLDRVCECDAEDCNWLFLDRSHGRSRRWCSMKSCGNRAKARRHYRRQKNQ